MNSIEEHSVDNNDATGSKRTVEKLGLTFLVFSIIFWLGAIGIRTIIANELFVTGTLEFEQNISVEWEQAIFHIISVSSLVIVIAYIIVLASAIVVLVSTPLQFKNNGWLLMAAILFFLFVPVELFTGFLDIKFIYLWQETAGLLETAGPESFPQQSTILRETLSHRIGALSGLPVIASLCYLSALAILIWQPMKRVAP